MHQKTLTGGIFHWGWTLSFLLLISSLICIGFDVIFPERFHMHQAWGPLLPGFIWLTLTGFVAGAVGSFLYWWYFALLGVSLHHLFGERRKQ